MLVFFRIVLSLYSSSFISHGKEGKAFVIFVVDCS